ncbi:hypothetical protein COLO4_32912 [Corchorus olitorius]|uniref:Uncharacterized protein n=1 Tax=Corchorus olitorius TaxID=93759 RepID=A0A1R3GXE8_9ROSI|nr:hypothetical protein COLO4_32912 [Corchorus olitorius]
MGGNASRGPLIPDLATILQDLASISIDLTLTEPNFHLPISEFNRPIGLVFGYVLPQPVLFTPLYVSLGFLFKGYDFELTVSLFFFACVNGSMD